MKSTGTLATVTMEVSTQNNIFISAAIGECQVVVDSP
jgi:hypothetical protein